MLAHHLIQNKCTVNQGINEEHKGFWLTKKNHFQHGLPEFMIILTLPPRNSLCFFSLTHLWSDNIFSAVSVSIIKLDIGA